MKPETKKKAVNFVLMILAVAIAMFAYNKYEEHQATKLAESGDNEGK